MLGEKIGLRTKLLTGFAVPVVAIVLIVIVVQSSISSLLQANHWVDHTHKVINEGKAILSSMVDMETGMRGFLITGKDEFLEPYIAGQQTFSSTVSKLKQTVSDNPAQVDRLKAIEQMKEAWITEAAEPQINLRREVAKGEAAARRFKSLSARTVGKERFDGMRAALAEVEQGLLEQNDLRGRFLLQAILVAMINQETGQRGFLLTGLEVSLEPWVQGQKDFDRYTGELREHFDRALYNTGSLQEALNTVVAMAKGWASEAASPEIEARREMNEVSATMDDITAFIETGAGKRHMDSIRSKIAEFIDTENKLIGVRTQEAADIAAMTTTLAVASALFAVAIVVVLSFFIVRSIQQQVGGEPALIAGISRQIADGDLTIVLHNTGKETGIYAAMRDMTERLRAMLSKISEASQSQAASTEELSTITEQTTRNVQVQQSSTDQVAVAIDEMQATAAEVASSTVRASESANEARSLVDLGNDKAETVSGEIQQLAANLNEATVVIKELAESAQNISNILDVIRGIADQTNLLALNAAIEAARAGEQGRGFAVVADEVRSLAQNTQNSTAEIEVVIEKVQKGATASVNSMTRGQQQAESIVAQTMEVKNALTEIKAAVHSITDMTTQIASAAEEQSATAAELNQRADEIREQSEQTGTGAQQIAVSTEELSRQAIMLQEEVTQFKV